MKFTGLHSKTKSKSSAEQVESAPTRRWLDGPCGRCRRPARPAACAPRPLGRARASAGRTGRAPGRVRPHARFRNRAPAHAGEPGINVHRMHLYLSGWAVRHSDHAKPRPRGLALARRGGTEAQAAIVSAGPSTPSAAARISILPARGSSGSCAGGRGQRANRRMDAGKTLRQQLGSGV